MTTHALSEAESSVFQIALAVSLYAENEFGRRKTFRQAERAFLKEDLKHRGLYLKQAKRVIAVLNTIPSLPISEGQKP